MAVQEVLVMTALPNNKVFKVKDCNVPELSLISGTFHVRTISLFAKRDKVKNSKFSCFFKHLIVSLHLYETNSNKIKTYEEVDMYDGGACLGGL